MSKFINEELLIEYVKDLSPEKVEEELLLLSGKIMVLGAKLNKEFDYDTLIMFVEAQMKIAAISKHADEMIGGKII